MAASDHAVYYVLSHVPRPSPTELWGLWGLSEYYFEAPLTLRHPPSWSSPLSPLSLSSSASGKSLKNLVTLHDAYISKMTPGLKQVMAKFTLSRCDHARRLNKSQHITCKIFPVSCENLDQELWKYYEIWYETRQQLIAWDATCHYEIRGCEHTESYMKIPVLLR